ncbi:MAG: ABC transporter permease [Blautia sp.]|nr:ABC transporter permease [Blautia sp.]
MGKSRLKGNGTWIALVLLVAAASALYKTTFFSANNIFNVLRQSSMIGYISVGMTCVILTGGIDLSVGATVALTAVLAAMLSNVNVVLAVMVPILVGICVGAVNGFVITKLKVVPFIATLAIQMAVRGIAYIITNIKSIPVNRDEKLFLAIGRGYLWKIPVPVVLFAVTVLVMILVTKKTSFGRSLFAIGGNESAALMMGMKVDRNKALAYILTGGLSGLAGVVLCSRLGAGQPVAGNGWEMDAIAAVAIGGTLLSGGVGGVEKTVSGVLITGLITNILNLQGNINTYVQNIINGVIVLIVIIIQRNMQSREK